MFSGKGASAELLPVPRCPQLVGQRAPAAGLAASNNKVDVSVAQVSFMAPRVAAGPRWAGDAAFVEASRFEVVQHLRGEDLTRRAHGGLAEDAGGAAAQSTNAERPRSRGGESRSRGSRAAFIFITCRRLQSDPRQHEIEARELGSTPIVAKVHDQTGQDERVALVVGIVGEVELGGQEVMVPCAHLHVDVCRTVAVPIQVAPGVERLEPVATVAIRAQPPAHPEALLVVAPHVIGLPDVEAGPRHGPASVVDDSTLDDKRAGRGADQVGVVVLREHELGPLWSPWLVERAFDVRRGRLADGRCCIWWRDRAPRDRARRGATVGRRAARPEKAGAAQEHGSTGKRVIRHALPTRVAVGWRRLFQLHAERTRWPAFALAPVDYDKVVEMPGALADGKDTVGFCHADGSDLWISRGTPSKPPIHIAIRAASRAEVDAFHQAAIAAGGMDPREILDEPGPFTRATC